MCKKALSILLVLTLAMTLPAFQAFAQEEEDIYDLKAKVVSLEESLFKVGELVKDLAFNVQENQALAEIVKEMSFQFKKSESDIHSIVTLQDRVERDLIPQIISLQSTVASLGASLNEKIKALGIRVYEMESSVQQLSARVRANEDRLRSLDGIEHDVRSLNERLYNVEKALERGAAMGASGAEGAGLADALQTLQEDVEMLKAQIGDGASLATLSNTIDSFRIRLSSIEINYATQEDVFDVQSQVDVLTAELQKVRNASSTNFMIGVLGVLAGIGAIALVFL